MYQCRFNKHRTEANTLFHFSSLKVEIIALHGAAVDTLQFFSSEPSPQSSPPSHIHILSTHAPLAQVIWLLRQGQFCSSDMSPQSSYLSHRYFVSRHLPFLHWNCSDGHEGLVVVTTWAAVDGTVIDFVLVDGNLRCWFLGSAVESGNIIGSWNNGFNGKRRKANFGFASIVLTIRNHSDRKIEKKKTNKQTNKNKRKKRTLS